MKHGTNMRRGLWAGALIAGLTLVGCLFNETESPKAGEGAATVSLSVGLAPVRAGLAKSATISLSKMIVVLTSSTNDTIRDTITTSTSPALNATSTDSQTVSKFYNLAVTRTWTATVSIRDTRDSLIHQNSYTTGILQAGDTAHITLSLTPRFTMYQAKFLSIPDSIGSSTPGTGKQKLYLNRFVFKVDGVTVVDSSVSPSYFAAGGTYTLFYDYVATGTHTIQLQAFGPMNSWNVTNPLYSGSKTILVGPSQDSTISVPLSWVGPTTGGGNLSVTINKVGTAIANGTLPTNVIP